MRFIIFLILKHSEILFVSKSYLRLLYLFQEYFISHS